MSSEKRMCIFIYLLMFLCGVLASNIHGQTSGKSGNSNDLYSVVLRCEVKSIKVENIDSSEVILTVNLKMELLNEGLKPVIFLAAKKPELRGAILAKTPDNFSAFARLALEYYGESMNTSPEWEALRVTLNQPSPPLDKVRLLMPNESWKWEDSVDIALPQKSDKNNFSEKKESWGNIKQLSTVWLRAICQVWSLNLESRSSKDITKKPFGHRLQKRWKDVGLLLLDDIQSEPIALDLKTAIIH